MVNVAHVVALAVVFGPRTHKQDANRQGRGPRWLWLAIRQPAADAHGAFSLEQPTVAVMKQFPGQRQQFSGGFAGGGLRFSGSPFGQVAVHLDGETVLGAIGGVLPGGERVVRHCGAQRGLEQVLPPLRQLLLDAFGAGLEYAHRPKVILFQIPAQVVGFDGTERRGEREALALDTARGGVGRFIGERGRGGDAAFAFVRFDFRVGEGEDEFFERFGLGLGGRLVIGGQAFAEGGEDGGQRVRKAAGAELDRDGKGFFAEPVFQRVLRETGQQ